MRPPVWLKAVLAQAGAALSVFLALNTTAIHGLAQFPGVAVAIHSGLAMLMSLAFGLPLWWLPIQGLFVPALLLTQTLDLPPEVFLAGFVLLWLIFRSNLKERVPLYLSNQETWRALAELLPQHSGFTFLDLGCGLGGTLAFLATQRPDGEFCGVESAPAPFFVSWLRLLQKANGHVRFGDMWRENLGHYDLVYVFLSPDPMPDLWRKAKSEMKPGALLVSNTFAVPGVDPTNTLVLEDSRRTRLLIWRI